MIVSCFFDKIVLKEAEETATKDEELSGEEEDTTVVVVIEEPEKVVIEEKEDFAEEQVIAFRDRLQTGLKDVIGSAWLRKALTFLLRSQTDKEDWLYYTLNGLFFVSNNTYFSISIFLVIFTLPIPFIQYSTISLCVPLILFGTLELFFSIFFAHYYVVVIALYRIALGMLAIVYAVPFATEQIYQDLFLPFILPPAGIVLCIVFFVIGTIWLIATYSIKRKARRKAAARQIAKEYKESVMKNLPAKLKAKIEKGDITIDQVVALLQKKKQRKIAKAAKLAKEEARKKRASRGSIFGSSSASTDSIVIPRPDEMLGESSEEEDDMGGPPGPPPPAMDFEIKVAKNNPSVNRARNDLFSAIRGGRASFNLRKTSTKKPLSPKALERAKDEKSASPGGGNPMLAAIQAMALKKKERRDSKARELDSPNIDMLSMSPVGGQDFNDALDEEVVGTSTESSGDSLGSARRETRTR